MAVGARISSATDLVAYACVVAGFVPVNSVWMLMGSGLTATREVGPDASTGKLSAVLSSMLRVGKANSAGDVEVLIVFGGPELRERLEAAVVDAAVGAPLIVQYFEGRVWVYRGDGERDMRGVAMDLMTHPIVLAGVERGVVLMPRDERAALWTVGTDAGDESAAVDACIADVLARWHSGPLTVQAAAGYAAEVGGLLDEVVGRRDRFLSAEEVARLAVAAQVIAVRDQLLPYIATSTSPLLTDVWRQVARRCRGRSGAAAAVVGGVAAYAGGHGGEVNMALDAALLVEPDHGLAGLMRRCVELGLAPAKVMSVIVDAAATTRD